MKEVDHEKLAVKLAKHYATYKGVKGPSPLVLGGPGTGKSMVIKTSFVLMADALSMMYVDDHKGDAPEYLLDRAKECSRNDVCVKIERSLSNVRRRGGKRARDSVEELLRSLPEAAERAMSVRELFPEAVEGLVITYDERIELNVFKNSFLLVYLPLSAMEPADLIGQPIVEKGIMEYALPKWVHASARAALSVIFIDEFTHEVSPELESALHSIVLDKRIGFTKVNNPVVAAGAEAAYSSLVKGLPAPLVVGRMELLKLKPPTIELWVKYMSKMYGEEWLYEVVPFLAITKGGLQKGSSPLFAPPTTMPNEGIILPGEDESFPTPRGWEYVLKAAKQVFMADTEGFEEMAVGVLGSSAELTVKAIGKVLERFSSDEELKESLEKLTLLEELKQVEEAEAIFKKMAFEMANVDSLDVKRIAEEFLNKLRQEVNGPSEDLALRVALLTSLSTWVLRKALSDVRRNRTTLFEYLNRARKEPLPWMLCKVLQLMYYINTLSGSDIKGLVEAMSNVIYTTVSELEGFPKGYWDRVLNELYSRGTSIEQILNDICGN